MDDSQSKVYILSISQPDNIVAKCRKKFLKYLIRERKEGSYVVLS